MATKEQMEKVAAVTNEWSQRAVEVAAKSDVLEQRRAALLAAEDALALAESEYAAADDGAEKALGKLKFYANEAGIDLQIYVPPVVIPDPPAPPVEPPVEPTE